jgi:hypothetical protein
MNGSIPVMTALSLILLGAAPAAAVAAAPAEAAVAASPGAAGPDESVIVMLKRQYTFPNTSAGTQQRVAAASAAQAPVLASLRRSQAREVTPLHLIDAVVATVSAAEAADLAASASVAEVIPNVVLRGPALPAGRAANSHRTSQPAPGVCPAAGKVQLNPEGAELVHAVSGNPGAPTARKLGFTGAGVTVGDIAAGIDPAETEMIRPDGQPVIAVYQDFTGEGTAVQGPDDLESYLDDSVMAAQGRLVYDLHDSTPFMPAGCDIRLQGVAPGITIDAYKVFASNDMTTLSAFVEAIDYAVNVNHVNVLNEEAGSFRFPDASGQDLITAANAAAMAAGVTITSPSFDAGPASTIWSPSSQPGVISTGASTAFRSYAQADIGEFNQAGADGWVSDNISALSSGGSTEAGRSIDVVAPGDLDWIACEPNTVACGTKNLTTSGGTSEAGPITAAVAALVIQAYRSTHGGADPSVSLVRDIITSSADDLGMPGSEQGAGLVDAYRAVKSAMAASQGRPEQTAPGQSAAGPALVTSTQQLAAIGSPGAPARMSFELSNDAAAPADVSLAARTLGPATTILRQTIHRTATSSDQIFPFALPNGAAVLTADIAYPGGRVSNRVQISLVNPNGQLTAYSFPQGTGNHGQAEVRNAAAGTWEADVSSQGPYHGPVFVQVTTAQMHSWGSVSPSHVTLAPGATTKVAVSARFPAQPGDQSASVTMAAPGWGVSTLPVTLRSLVPIVNGTGHFHATLAGGNGRGGAPAQRFYYNVDVPAGQPALDVQARLAGHNNDPFFAYLIDPQGQAVAQASNQLVVRHLATISEPGARLHTLAPSAGRWTIIITFTNPVTGNAVATGLSGTVSFAPVMATVRGLPDSQNTVLGFGTQHVVKVTVRNDGDAAESYFLDGRLDQTQSLRLTSITPARNLNLPLPGNVFEPQWIVPTDSTSVTAAARSSAPTTFDVSPLNGDPDAGATVSGNDASATITAQPGTFLTQGDWDIDPQQAGPFGPGGAAPAATTLTLTATTAAFDPDLTSSTGDLWQQGGAAQRAFAPVIVQPGQTTTLFAVITPLAIKGSVIRGVLYLDDASALSNQGPSPSGDQLEALPYEYKVG